MALVVPASSLLVEQVLGQVQEHYLHRHHLTEVREQEPLGEQQVLALV